MKAIKNANGAARVAIQAKMSELDTAIAEVSEYKRKHYATQRELDASESRLSFCQAANRRLVDARRADNATLAQVRRVSEQRLVHCQNLAESEHNLRERLGYAMAASWIGWLTAFGFLGNMILQAL